ncbi:MAG TPA: class I SAM-dependent methyltransferase [Candidatus Saccharimonas sp.]|nr:class I SAM-dependent methyltransferase [Candidatus Saccharimonas sp.]
MMKWLAAVLLGAWAGAAAAYLLYLLYGLRLSVPFVPLPRRLVRRVVAELELAAGDEVWDLGCGDGRVLAECLRVAGVSAVGVEQNPSVWLLAKWRLGRRARVVRGDLRQQDLRRARRVVAFLGLDIMAELEPKLERELPKGARLVAVQFALPTRQPVRKVELEGAPEYARWLYVYEY